VTAAAVAFEEWVSAAADQWESTASHLARSGLYPPFYLYIRPSTETQDGALYMVPESKQALEDWQLGDPQAYRCNLTREQVRARIWTAARRLPLHAWGKSEGWK
jgi:hypothetical protein